jgi:uncharacterized membrane protein SpoIIM required for sporulation
VLAIVVFLIVTVAPVYSYSFIMDNFDKLRDIKFRNKFMPLIESTKVTTNSTLNQMWIPIFLFRRYTYAGILCVLQGIPILQLILCII